MREVVMAGFLVLAPLLSRPAHADDAARSQAQEALERTDRRIELADSFVGETSTPSATGELADARQGQSRARSAFRSTEYPTCVIATLNARDHADRAIAIVRNLPDPDRVQAQVSRTRDVLERARHRVDGCDNPRAAKQLRMAQAMQERAEGALAESRYLAALQLTMSARDRAATATGLCTPDDPLGDSTASELRRTDDALARARESLGGGVAPLARNRLARAQALQAQAQSEARAVRYESALQLTGEARVLAQRALRPARGARGPRAR